MEAVKKATANDRCPRCGQRMPTKRIPPPAAPVTRCVLERQYGIKRRNGGFV